MRITELLALSESYQKSADQLKCQKCGGTRFQTEGVMNFVHRLKGDHHNCGVHSHWNDKRARCEQLPRHIQADLDQAQMHSSAARSSSRHDAGKHHQMAAERYHAAGKSLAKAGFSAKAKDLHNIADQHHQKAAAITTYW